MNDFMDRCVIEPDGGLACKWYHPDALGRIEPEAQLFGPDVGRRMGFRAAQPSKDSGRVHVLPGGHLITKYKLGHERWLTRYVGKVESRRLGDWSHWIE